MAIVFAVLDDNIIKVGKATLDEIAPQLCASSSFGKEILKIGDRQVEAIYFHKPEEPYGFLSNWYLSDIVVDGKLSQRQHIIRRVDTTAKDRSFEAAEGHHDGVVVVDGKLIGFGIHMGALTGGMRTTRTPCRLA